MTSIIEYFEEEINSLSTRIDDAILKRLKTQESIENYKNSSRKMAIDQKMQILKIIEEYKN